MRWLHLILECLNKKKYTKNMFEWFICAACILGSESDDQCLSASSVLVVQKFIYLCIFVGLPVVV